MRFYLGTHQVCWFTRLRVPLFVSRQRLKNRKKLPIAQTVWALDSGGFTELQRNGAWNLSATDYVAEIRRYANDIGSLEWAAPQDWMCEPSMVAKTGLTIAQHQQKTLANFLELRSLETTVKIVPVLQGWHPEDYLRHVESYYNAGVRLHEEELVGVGTMCRRQGTEEALAILSNLWGMGLKLHAFGFKFTGLRAAAPLLASADSLAWSQNARHREPLPGCRHAKCSSCERWAIAWRDRLLANLPTECQRVLF